MVFKMNDRVWEIAEWSQEEIKTYKNKRRNNSNEDVKSIADRYYGVTFYDDLRIVLDKDLPTDVKMNVLKHELAHCYIISYITLQDKTYTEEDVCDLIANSHNIIATIVNEYIDDTQ